jgi:hypothetical protein
MVIPELGITTRWMILPIPRYGRRQAVGDADVIMTSGWMLGIKAGMEENW